MSSHNNHTTSETSSTLLKRCSRCKELKPRNAENFQPNKTTGFNSCCRPCYLKGLRIKIAEHHANRDSLQARYDGQKRTCKMCGSTADLNNINFKWQNSGANFSHRCRKCENLVNRNRQAKRMSIQPDEGYASVYEQKNCLWCGVVLTDDAQIDHIIPLSRGGTSHSGNLAMVCRECNAQKKAMLPYEFIQFLREVGKL